ncbi:MAG: hypothetical protein R3Y50_04770 [Rikenellaceae bacterium]
MSNTFDVKSPEVGYEMMVEEFENRKGYYVGLFFEFCAAKFPTWQRKNGAIYIQSLKAADAFAMAMIEDENDIAGAYEIALKMMFKAQINS